MSASRSLKDDHPLPYPGASQAAEDIQQQAQDARATARDTRAQMHTILSRTRQLFKQAAEIIQHRQARREYEAEHRVSAPTVPDKAGIDILLITGSPVDVARFRYALRASALPCPMKVLTERSEVEAFVRRAATADPLFLPQLIITECQLPGMEAEEIIAAVHTVPAYRRIPLLLFSTLEEAEGQWRCRQCGTTAFVRKPSDFEAVLSAVATMVRQWGGVGGGSDVTLANSQ